MYFPQTPNYFYRDHTHSDGLKSWCKECYAEADRKRYENNNIDSAIYQRAQNIHSSMISHAKRRGIEVDLKYFTTKRIYDIIKNKTYCSCCGRPMINIVTRGGHPDPATVTFDRFNSDLGYTKDNTHVICWRCNHLKSDATCKEINTIAKWMKSVNSRE